MRDARSSTGRLVRLRAARRPGPVSGADGGGGPVLEVGLVQGCVVDGEGAPAVGDDVVPRHADDPLDEIVAGVLGQEVNEDEGVADDAAQAGGVLDVESVVGVGEDDDVAAYSR